MDLNISLYSVLKFFHVLLVVIAVGANISYAVWFARAAKEPEHRGFALKGIQVLDDKITNPAYFVVLLLGVGMVLDADLGFDTFWIAAALVLYVVVAVMAATQFTPLLRRQIAMVDAGEDGTPEFQRLAARGLTIGMAMGVIVGTIIALMVLKPTL